MHKTLLRYSPMKSLGMVRYLLLAMVAFLCSTVTVDAQHQVKREKTFGLPTELSPSARVSFLAAQPSSEESYTLYGHAGLRVYDQLQDIDVTFNYGIFDFSDDFTIRYLQGRTDYIVLPIATELFLEDYQHRGLIQEVILQTDSLQRARMWSLLLENIQPENRVYRYNAFRNNCSTRPLDLYLETLTILFSEKGATDSVSFAFASGDDALFRQIFPGVDPSALPPLTWRQAINELEASSPWLVLGTDLAMGPELDQPMSVKDRFFIPMQAAALLPLLSVGNKHVPKEAWVRPALTTKSYGALQHIEPASFSLTHPMLVFTLVLILSGGIFIYRRKGKTVPGAIEFVFYLGAGLAGSLLTFITFFSEHPMVYPNWNLLALHPGYLLLAVLMPFGAKTLRVRYVLHAVCFVALIALPFVGLLSGQKFNSSLSLIAMSLTFLSAGRLIHNPFRRHG